MTAAHCFAVRWPSPLLSPDCKCAAGRIAAEAAKARKVGFLTIRRAAPLACPDQAGGAALSLVFVPPNLRRYSPESLLLRMVPTLDGIADFLGITADQLRVTWRLSHCPTPGGAVLIKLELR